MRHLLVAGPHAHPTERCPKSPEKSSPVRRSRPGRSLYAAKGQSPGTGVFACRSGPEAANHDAAMEPPARPGPGQSFRFRPSFSGSGRRPLRSRSPRRLSGFEILDGVTAGSDRRPGDEQSQEGGSPGEWQTRGKTEEGAAALIEGRLSAVRDKPTSCAERSRIRLRRTFCQSGPCVSRTCDRSALPSRLIGIDRRRQISGWFCQ